ncbi:MAG TPA: ribokinase [Mycobacterium sp.]|nr:ribokinase [Mycobacterium sp.]
MKTRVCVVGSVNMDTVLTVDTLPVPGQTVLATSAKSIPGGKGANQSVAAARAGAQVRFVGAVGDDPAADRLRRHLQDNDVDITGLATAPGPSGTAVIAVDAGGENMIIVAPGANAALNVVSSSVDAIVTGCQVLLLQLEIPVAAATAAARAARAAGALVMVNASPAGGDPAERAALAELADVVVVNETESDAWVWPVEHRVITRGARGARYLGADGSYDVPAPAVPVVDTSGAGDVFAGVLAASWTAGREHALRRACAAGALATRVPGAGDCAPQADAIAEAVLFGR